MKASSLAATGTLAIVLSMSCGSGSALAADGPVAESNGGEIIVTARKRDESLQEVPIAVTVISGDALEKRGFTSFNDISASNPNVKIQAQSGVSTFSSNVAIRGNVQASGTLQVDPSVGTYIDGFLLAHTMGTAQMTVDIESVQTLKGPQGTLFGRNTTGGALLLKTRDPKLGEVSGYVQADVGGLETIRLGGAINLPLGDVAALRVVYQNNSRGDYQFFEDGRQLGHKEEEVLRAKLLVEPIDGTRIVATAERLRESGNATNSLVSQPNAPAYKDVPIGNFPLGPNSTYPIDLRAMDEFGAIEAEFYGLLVEQEIGSGAVKLLVSHRAYDIRSSLTLPPLFGFTMQDKPQNKDFAAELQYSGSFIDDRLDLSAGLYYFDETVHEAQDTFFYSGLQRTSNYLTATSESKSGYIQGTGRLTDALNLTLGLRYTDDVKTGLLVSAKSDTVNTVTETISGTNAQAAMNPLASLRQAEGRTNYLITVDYSPVSDVMVYASHSTGYRAGGAGVDRQSEDPTSPGYFLTTFFLPESIKNYEVGFKTDLFDRRLTFNGAGFYQDYKSYQFTAIVDAVRVTQNADAEIKGFEFDARLQVGSGTTISADVGYTMAKVKQADLPQHGQRLPLIPKLQWGVSLTQNFEVAGGDLDLVANYSWRDNFWTALEDPSVPATSGEPSWQAVSNIEALGLVNLSATYENGPVSLAVYANNLTNEKYYTFITFGGAPLHYGGLGVPRVIGARAKYSF